MTPLRVAFVGAGQMAGLHLHALRRVEAAHTVVGVHDPRGGAAQAFAQRAGHGARAYATLAELLADARPTVAHICTPAGTHFEPARAALLAGAHVYVEKPFVETQRDAESLLDLAREQGLLVCAGHQLVRDAAFRHLMERAATLAPIALVDSYFAFRPPRLASGAAPQALAAQLLDVVPHPLYTLVAALERFAPRGAPVTLHSVTATATDLHAQLVAGSVVGRLCVSLRARPVASTLMVAGAHGSLTADFVRAIVHGAANEGTSPLEKIANPFLEAGQLAWRSAASLAGRLARGADYPGLAELLGEFYAGASRGGQSPLSVSHLRQVTALYEELATNVRSVAQSAGTRVTRVIPEATGPLAVLTGASGFFGRAIARELARLGFRVRGIGRAERSNDPNLHDWVRADLAEAVPTDALTGAAVVVHAAAETAGGFEAHERNTAGVTRRLLDAMAAAGTRRLVHISSISVLRPPSGFWERQTEDTPRAARPERLGPYTWGKCVAERMVEEAATTHGIEARIIRPAALIDWNEIELPGLMGRRLFGRWHLGLGRPGLPFAVCDVTLAARVVAWCAEHFSDAPPRVNLFDPTIRTRRQLVQASRAHGWVGRMVWVPISLLAALLMVARRAAALIRGERALPLAAWSVLRPRRYDPTQSAHVIAATGGIHA